MFKYHVVGRSNIQFIQLYVSLGNKILLTFFFLRWRSSLWKLLWKELLIYTVLFLIVSMIYRSDSSRISLLNKMGMRLCFTKGLFKEGNMSTSTLFILLFYKWTNEQPYLSRNANIFLTEDRKYININKLLFVYIFCFPSSYFVTYAF